MEPNFKNKYFIETSKDGVTGDPIYSVIEGLKDVDDSTNEEVSSEFYFENNGFGESTVTGLHPQFSLTLDKKSTAVSYEYFMGLRYSFDRDSSFKIEYSDGSTLTVPVTIAEITPPSGGAAELGEYSVALHFNGAPTITPAA